jgi:hypothetical protein
MFYQPKEDNMTFEIVNKKHTEKFSMAEMELIYDALNEYPQWNDDEDDNPTSRIMNKLYNLLENAE